MLRLNSITLFFHDLSGRSRTNDEESSRDVVVGQWRAKVDRPKSSSSGSVPSLTGHSKRTESSKTSTKSKRSALAGNVAVKIVSGNNEEDEEKGLSDRDETFGVERDDAHSSPVKPPKSRATSTVS